MDSGGGGSGGWGLSRGWECGKGKGVREVDAQGEGVSKGVTKGVASWGLGC